MRVLAVASQKGGSGKTTLAGHLAVQAERAGAGPVALLDLDPQGTLADWSAARGAQPPAFAPSGTARLAPDTDKPSLRRVLDGQGRLLGRLARTSPFADQMIGYQGPTDTLIAQKPEAVRAAVRAALKGQRFLQTNRAAVLPIMAEYMSLSLDEAALAYDNTVAHFTADGRVSPELQERMVQDQIEVVQPERVPKARDLFTLQFVEDD